MAPDVSGTPTVLVTGAARRIGKSIAKHFHAAGFRVIAHYQNSAAEADRLCEELNHERADSCLLIKADLGSAGDRGSIQALVQSLGRLDTLVNNASRYYPTTFAEVTESQWQDLVDSNLKGAFFLSQQLAELLRKARGSIINISDRNARQAQRGYSAYSIAKGGVISMTRSLALELAPEVRVNCVAPGVILWPENEAAISEDAKTNVQQAIPAGRLGTPEEIAATVFFLATGAHYITGQTIAVDGGSSNCF